ncbi:MAG: LuxR C-terminal-related transcriptional regulator, partial [Sulfurovum sp.]|uniref:transcriptional regulator n=1 Tax=Sulfurovum sp. TaxID=1969726 RepID=UPI003C710600
NITELYQIFKGFLSKKDAIAFTDELQMKNAIMLPMYNFDKREIIGYVCFFFQSDVQVDMKKLEAIKTSFQIILQPLYDRENNTFFTKCVRIDEDMQLLTPQEKKIVKKMLEGLSYPEISAILGISINTLKTHMKNIFNKYNVNSKIELYNKLNASVQ